LSFGGLDLAVDVGERSITLVKETAGIGERGCRGWVAWKWLKGHDGKMKDGQREERRNSGEGLMVRGGR
jgi:hypothetical protein